MLNKFAPIAILGLCLALPTAAHAQLDSWQADEAISDILGAGFTAAQVRHLRQVPSVGVFDVKFGVASRRRFGGDQRARLEIFAEKNTVGVNQLRRALAANPVTRRTMAQHGVNVNRVLGVSVGGTGSLRFFVD